MRWSWRHIGIPSYLQHPWYLCFALVAPIITNYKNLSCSSNDVWLVEGEAKDKSQWSRHKLWTYYIYYSSQKVFCQAMSSDVFFQSKKWSTYYGSRKFFWQAMSSEIFFSKQENGVYLFKTSEIAWYQINELNSNDHILVVKINCIGYESPHAIPSQWA